jgi:Uncharacterised nucleotidyltransferase
VKSSAELVTRITPEQRLLLRAVLLHGEPARHAFQEWRAAVVIDDVDGVSQRLLPLLARRLGDVGPDDPVRSLIRGIYRHAWVRSHRLWRDALPVFVAMRDRGIPVILLKGAALLHAYGNDWGARPMFDIDALVRPEHAQGAFAVLEELGWTAEYDMTFDWVRSRSMTRRHGWGFLREDGRLDMHWHVLSESLGSHSDDAFWADAVPLETEGFTALTLAPPDLLLHLLVHGVSGMNAPTVQWISDAIHVARTYGADAMAERFVRQARAHGELAKVSEALAAIGMLVDPHELATVAARVSRERAAPVERLRRAGTAGEQLAQRAAGGNGLARGAVELVTDRLDLGLATSSALSVAYAASGRAPVVARLGRRFTGSFAHAAVAAPNPVVTGVELDFTQPATLDQYGGTGWGRAEDGGSTTRGGEARLVLPLAPALRQADLECEITLHARGVPTTIEVRANEIRVALVDVATQPTTHTVVIPRSLVAGATPLEITFRRRRSGTLSGRGAANLRLERVCVRAREGTG